MKHLVLLAAGKGERLKPLTDTRPKVVLPVAGESLLCKHIKKASSTGSYDKIAVVISYGADLVIKELEKCGVDVELVYQKGELGTGDAIAKAIETGGPGDYTVIYGDVFIKSEVYELIARATTPSVFVTEVEEAGNYGVVEIDSEGFLKSITEKPQNITGPSLVFAGILKISYEHLSFFKNLKPSPRGEFEATDALNDLSKQYEVKTFPIPKGSWIDIGRPWDFLKANIIALSEIKGQVIKGDVSERAELSGPIVVESNSSIKPYTVVEGPAYIGRGAVIGPLAHVRGNTVVCEESFVGPFSQVKSSVLLERARLPHMNYVGDSVIGEHVNLGAGSKIANLRFNEQTVEMTVKGVRVKTGLKKLGSVIGGYAKIGINVSIMPGVKIGSYAVVYPGCVVFRDVDSGEVFNCWSR